MPDTTSQSLSEDLRRVANKLRSSSMPLSDLIPMLQRAADALDKRREMDAKAEPAAWLWQHSETGRTRVVLPDQIITADASWIVVGPLHFHPPAAQDREPMTDEQIEKLREKTFSTNNPFCPVDSKSMRKAVRATEASHNIKEPQR